MSKIIFSINGKQYEGKIFFTHVYCITYINMSRQFSAHNCEQEVLDSIRGSVKGCYCFCHQEALSQEILILLNFITDKTLQMFINLTSLIKLTSFCIKLKEETKPQEKSNNFIYFQLLSTNTYKYSCSVRGPMVVLTTTLATWAI